MLLECERVPCRGEVKLKSRFQQFRTLASGRGNPDFLYFNAGIAAGGQTEDYGLFDTVTSAPKTDSVFPLAPGTLGLLGLLRWRKLLTASERVRRIKRGFTGGAKLGSRCYIQRWSELVYCAYGVSEGIVES
jgi:hypothetical protein